MQVMGKLMAFLRRKSGAEDDPALQVREGRKKQKHATTIPDERTIRRLLDAHNSNLAFLSEHLDEYCRQQPEQYLGKFLVIAKGGEIFETFPSERKADEYFHGLPEDTQDEAAIWFIDDSEALEGIPDMIIRGFWVRGKPVCYGGIILRGRIYIPVELEVDTGASITMVSDVKNRIDPDIEKEWGIQTKQVNAFGGTVDAYEIQDCILVLDGISGKVHHVELQKFYLAKKTRPSKLRRYIPFVRQKTRKGDIGTSHKNSPPPPNVLGRDVLSKFLLVMDGRSSKGIWLTSRPTKIEIEDHPVMHFGKDAAL